MSYIDKSCSEFAEILAAGTPVPGGGSAAATAASLADLGKSGVLIVLLSICSRHQRAIVSHQPASASFTRRHSFSSSFSPLSRSTSSSACRYSSVVLDTGAGTLIWGACVFVRGFKKKEKTVAHSVTPRTLLPLFFFLGVFFFWMRIV